MKRMFMIIMGLAMFLCPMRAGVELPGDMATIEALISLHKMMKSEEDEAMRKIAVSFGEQSVVTKGAKKFNDVRTTLDSKLNNMHSYVIFAASISRWSVGTTRRRCMPARVRSRTYRRCMRR